MKYRSILIAMIVLMLSPMNAVAYVADRKLLTLEQLSVSTGAIYTANVLSVNPRYGLDNYGYPITEIKLNVVVPITNNVLEGDMFTIYLPEGHYDNMGIVSIDGTAKFNAQREYLIFHRNGTWHQSFVLGWEMGLFQKMYDFATGEDVFVDSYGSCLAGINGKGLMLDYNYTDPIKHIVAIINDQIVYGNVKKHSSTDDISSQCISADNMLKELAINFGFDYSGRELVFQPNNIDDTMTAYPVYVSPDDDSYDSPPSCEEDPNATNCIYEGVPNESH